MLSDSTPLQHQQQHQQQQPPPPPHVMPASTPSHGAIASIGGVDASNGGAATIKANAQAQTAFPPPKTDKPRPHVCGTCQRSFARLEHLKRHERSHTKEKPFECPECTRCFARRDLLLRHQQKLHMTTTPSSRPRNRRESTSSAVAGSRVRKNSTVNGAGNTMRPRANTISHVERATSANLLAANSITPPSQGSVGGHSRHASLIGLPVHTDLSGYGGMPSHPGQIGIALGLAKLETSGFNNLDFGGGLKTAPIGSYGNTFDFESFLGPSGSTTINPNALHYSDSPQSMAIDSQSPYHHAFPDMSASQALDENFDWMNGFDHHLNFNGNENALDGSSPSAISTASQSGISEVMLDGSNNASATSGSIWQQPSMMAPPLMTPNLFALDMSNSGFTDLFNAAPMSPQAQPPKKPNDPYFTTPPPSMTSLSPLAMPGLMTQGLPQPTAYAPETPVSMHAGHLGSPLYTVTDSTRQSLAIALAQCTPHGGRKYSFPSVSSPLSPNFAGRSNNLADASRNLPSTADLQRYICAYIQYFHPHLPFLHIPTLSFDIPSNQGTSQSGMVGGHGCLILSMAAIGALYEMEQLQSKELFDSAKKMIQLYLEERRKADVRKADMRRAGMSDQSPHAENAAHTPVWLVQAMLLNVVYGHNCGDKTAGDIASTHCAALVSLARAAELLRPTQLPGPEIRMMDDDGWTTKQEWSDEQTEWYNWRVAEERKRTLYAVFIMSSLLVSAYNHSPALTNSEILLDLPCEEEFWSADSATSFQSMGGVMMASRNQTTFHDALGELLRTSEKQTQQQQMNRQPFNSGLGARDLPQSDLKPSTFGCFVLINALHNYIWETRQRHHNKIWTNEETEKMHRHIEPALKAWQAAWASNPHHSLERPNPFGLGPLSADSIPLLDLAYVRLFVNLSRSKEKFWQRDYDGMAAELSRGHEIIQHAMHSPASNIDSSTDPSETSGSSGGFEDSPATSSGSPDLKPMPPTVIPSSNATSKRERHLRKAAFYAADSLSMSDKLGVTFADFTSRELPLQSAMCAFDCAQVLAEWTATVQERVGPYLGILGKDDVDFSQVPGIMLLEEEDCKLLMKIQEVLNSAEVKINYELQGMGATGNVQGLMGESWGYGSKILKLTAYTLDKAAVWPVTHLMARALETQANHIRARAESSISQRE